jgi:hypothetical protein
MRRGIWAEYASTATFYANILVNRESQKPDYESMFELKFKRFRIMKIFGEMVVVATKKRIQGKLSDRGTVCTFLGYLQNHSDNVYRLFNINTMKVIKSRDFIRLAKGYDSLVSSHQNN